MGKPFRVRIVRYDAIRGDGISPANASKITVVCGPLTRMTDTPDGGAPLERANMVSFHASMDLGLSVRFRIYLKQKRLAVV